MGPTFCEDNSEKFSFRNEYFEHRLIVSDKSEQYSFSNEHSER